ncbi:hypothetical protein M0804_001631 [Polistes exclamans]|nr:hypothetical protein M0804_001631 [Polistes exclamans]
MPVIFEDYSKQLNKSGYIGSRSCTEESFPDQARRGRSGVASSRSITLKDTNTDDFGTWSEGRRARVHYVGRAAAVVVVAAAAAIASGLIFPSSCFFLSFMGSSSSSGRTASAAAAAVVAVAATTAPPPQPPVFRSTSHSDKLRTDVSHHRSF